ncbi:hypothetical protein WP8W19C02_P10550 (plasmid) [Enterobacter cloacae]|nr:hypothetical protein N037_20270 [Enterobacter sp. EGD-HP1]BBT93008.1 hypothetical protein WP8W19C02_P10550 [Enterobacter cloacae]
MITIMTPVGMLAGTVLVEDSLTGSCTSAPE